MKEAWIDPVVEESRAAGDALARSVDYDAHKFAELMRESEKRYPERVVSHERPRGGAGPAEQMKP